MRSYYRRTTRGEVEMAVATAVTRGNIFIKSMDAGYRKKQSVLAPKASPVAVDACNVTLGEDLAAPNVTMASIINPNPTLAIYRGKVKVVSRISTHPRYRGIVAVEYVVPIDLTKARRVINNMMNAVFRWFKQLKNGDAITLIPQRVKNQILNRDTKLLTFYKDSRREGADTRVFHPKAADFVGVALVRDQAKGCGDSVFLDLLGTIGGREEVAGVARRDGGVGTCIGRWLQSAVYPARPICLEAYPFNITFYYGLGFHCEQYSLETVGSKLEVEASLRTTRSRTAEVFKTSTQSFYESLNQELRGIMKGVDEGDQLTKSQKFELYWQSLDSTLQDAHKYIEMRWTTNR
jgi:hypothetical protein